MGLQRQLEVSNPDVEAARQELAAQFKGLTDNATSEAAATNQAIAGAQENFSNYQNQLRNYLMGQADDAKSIYDTHLSSITGTPYGTPEVNDAATRFNMLMNVLGTPNQSLETLPYRHFVEEQKTSLPKTGLRFSA